MFDLDLNPASTQGRDAKASDGRNVEIKFTQGQGIAIRHEPDHLLVLYRSRGDRVRVAFNGPGHIAWQAAGKMQSNGQRPISLSKLKSLARQVPESDSLPEHRAAPI